MNPDACTILPENTLVGRNRIDRFLWMTPYGAFYEMTIGSTTHEYGLLILKPSLCPPSVEDLRAYLEPFFAAVNPCLAKPFACGENDGKVWIRMDITDAVRPSAFTAERVHVRPGDAEEEARVEDASDLLTLSEGPVPQLVVSYILGDLIEGMVALHKTGGLLGPLSLHDIGFSEWNRSHGVHVISRWCNYGLQPLLDPSLEQSWTPQDDILMLMGHIKTLLCGPSSTTLPASIWPEWKAFLGTGSTRGGFADATALEKAFLALLAAHKHSRIPRVRPEDTIAPVSRAEAISAPRTRKHSSRGHSRGMHSMQSGNKAKHSLFLIGGLAFVGIVVLLVKPDLLKNGISGARDILASGSDGAQTEQETKTEATPAKGDEKAAKADVWSLTFDELKLAAEDSTNLVARMRYAFELAEGWGERKPDMESAQAIASEVYAEMENRAIGADAELDHACEFWQGYALLTGLGVEADFSQGRFYLERVEEKYNDLRAKSILADYYASGAEDGPNEVNDTAALTRWLAILEQEPQSRNLTYEGQNCANKVIAFYYAGRAVPSRNQDRYIAQIENIARRRHIPACLALGRIYLDGKLAKMDEVAAKKWYGDAAHMGSPDGMYHIGWMLERGIASTPSDRAASIWYRRAASSGHVESMQALARLLREKRIKTEAGEVVQDEGGKNADEWEEAAKEVAAPQPLPYTTWWLGAQGNRFPSPELVHAN